MSVIDREHTHYKRHVFYLYSSAFDAIGHSSLTSFFDRTQNGELLALSYLEAKLSLMSLLENLTKALDHAPSPLEEALGLSYIIQIFYLLNQKDCQPKSDNAYLPENILKIQNYIDHNFSAISSV